MPKSAESCPGVNAENTEDVGTFNEALRSATDPNYHQILFSDVSPPSIQVRGAKGDWNFNCSLKEKEGETQ